MVFSLIDGQNKLPKVASLFDTMKHLPCACPRERFKDRAQGGKGDSPIHFFEIPARANIDAANLYLFVKNEGKRNVLRPAGKHTNLGNSSSHAHCAQRLRKGADAANFHNEIHALATSLLDDPVIPLRRLLVVETRIEAKAMSPVQFLITTGYAENACSHHAREL